MRKIGDELYQEGDVVTLSKDTVLMAVWKVKVPDEDPTDDPTDEPVDEPTELVLPVPDKPATVKLVAFKRKSDQKTTDDPSDTPADAARSEEKNANVTGGNGGKNAGDTAGNGKYRSPNSGDGSEPLLWVMILVVMGMMVCGVYRMSKTSDTQA